RRNELGEAPPRIREEAPHVVEEPLHLAAPAQENAAQDEAQAPLGMRLAVSERECAAPRATEDHPALDAERDAQPLDVLHQMGGRVVRRFGQWHRAAGAALVEQHDAVAAGVEIAAVGRSTA